MGFYDLNPDFNYHVKKIKCRNKKIKKKKKNRHNKKITFAGQIIKGSWKRIQQ